MDEPHVEPGPTEPYVGTASEQIFKQTGKNPILRSKIGIDSRDAIAPGLAPEIDSSGKIVPVKRSQERPIIVTEEPVIGGLTRRTD